MAIKFELDPPKFYRGSVAGLSDPTAIATIHCQGSDVTREHALVERVAKHAGLLDIGDVGWGGEADLPAAFVLQLNGPATLAHWILALSVALQRSVRDPVWRGQVLAAPKGIVRLAIPYRRAAVAREALRLALTYVAVCSAAQHESEAHRRLAAEVDAWRDAARQGGLSPLALRFFAAARRREMPVTAEGGILQIGWGKQAERMDGSFTGRTATIATRVARNKWSARHHLMMAGLPVARAALVANREHARRVAEQLGWPVVVKPANQDRGIGVVAGIRDEASLLKAFDAAARHSPAAVLVEKHVEGDDYRMLVVGGRLIAVARRAPGGVRGDGKRTIAELLDEVNADRRRGTDYRSPMIRLAFDEEALRCLADRGLQPASVPPAGEFVPLRNMANISAGGTSENVGEVHPDNRRLAERAARTVGLDIAGVDFLSPDISRSWREVGGVVCEVNAQPGFRPHWLAEPHRDINGEIVDWLFRGKRARIPTTAITGTNGKTTVARMLHHIWSESGLYAGVCTTQGVWVGRDAVSHDNLSGEPGGRMLLGDSTVEAAVIEMPRKALMLFGHPCDRYDVAALLNVQDDHIGRDGIDSLEAMAALKAQVLQRARQAVILNADDSLCLAVRERLRPVRQVLVARGADNAALVEHLRRNGRAVFVEPRDESDWIVLAHGSVRLPLISLRAIPATMNGLLRCNETNAMFAAALAWAHGVPQEQIRRALGTFRNDLESNPGRYNWLEGLPFKLLLDFGHNAAGVHELLNVVRQIPVAGRRVLVSTIGNRHRRHFEDVAPRLAAEFDRIYLAQDESYLRRDAEGYGDDPLGELLDTAQALLGPLMRAPGALQLRRTRAEAMRDGLDACRAGDLLVMLAEPPEALAELQSYQTRIALGQTLPAGWVSVAGAEA